MVISVVLMSSSRWLPAKKITLCRAGAGRTIPASDRRLTGFAGDPRGVYLHCPSRSFDMAMEASFRSHGANQSQADFGNRTWVVSAFGPEQVGSQPRLSWSMSGAGLEIAERYRCLIRHPASGTGDPHGAYPRSPSRT